MLMEALRAEWAARRTTARVSALPEFDAGALTLGATKLHDPEAIGSEADREERAIALLSVAIGRPLEAHAVAHARKAISKARDGDGLLALTHLALAGVGRANPERR